MSFQFSERYFRSVSSLSNDSLLLFYLADFQINKAVSYIKSKEEYYSFDEEKGISNKFFEMGKYDYAEGQVVFLLDSMEIGGVYCKKAILNYLIDSQNETIAVWYNPKLVLRHAQIKNIFSDIPGLPVKIDFLQKPRLTIGAVRVVKSQLILEAFSVAHQSQIGVVADAQKYKQINKEEAIQKLATILVKSRRGMPQIDNKGKAITDTVRSSDGTTQLLTKYNPFDVGTSFPDFEAKNLAGVVKNKANYAGKITVINFWHTACGPCIKEMPALNKIKKAYASNNKVDFLAITFNTKEEVQKFFDKYPFEFELLLDAISIIEKMAVSTYPATVVLDKNPKIIFSKIGDATGELKDVIEKAMQ
jgi:thiol-disulfide isomerase/thioredoxin